MPFLPRLTDEQIAEALRKANLPPDTPVVGIFYDNAGGQVEIRVPGNVIRMQHGELTPAPPVEAERPAPLFPKPVEET